MPEGEVIVMRVKRVPPLLLFLVACLSLPLLLSDLTIDKFGLWILLMGAFS
jgi:hypothetical protein